MHCQQHNKVWKTTENKVDNYRILSLVKKKKQKQKQNKKTPKKLHNI